jgi:hypothetical protein
MDRNTFRENIKNIYNHGSFKDDNVFDDQLRNNEFNKFDLANEKSF